MNIKQKIVSLLAAAVAFVAYGSMSESTAVHARIVPFSLSNDTVKGKTAIQNVAKRDTVIDLGVAKNDTLAADTARNDSTKKKDPLDAPVVYSAGDSMTYDADLKKAYLFGDGNVKYENMELKAGRIEMNMDSSLVHAYGVEDSTGVWEGLPVYTQGSEKYDSDVMSFNFKTKKGFINNVKTEQGDGYMQSESSKRAKDGTLYLEHAKYTTCDAKHPDFYLALSRAKVKPGKEVVFGPAYLVVADVPLPLAVPYGFFPFKKKVFKRFPYANIRR